MSVIQREIIEAMRNRKRRVLTDEDCISMVAVLVDRSIPIPPETRTMDIALDFLDYMFDVNRHPTVQ